MKATSHVECPPKERHIRSELMHLISFDSYIYTFLYVFMTGEVLNLYSKGFFVRFVMGFIFPCIFFI